MNPNHDTTAALRIVSRLPDSKVVPFFENVSDLIVDGLETEPPRSVGPPSPTMQKLFAVSDDAVRSTLAPTHAIALCRALLRHMAHDEMLARLIQRVWRRFARDEMAAEPNVPTAMPREIVRVLASPGRKIRALDLDIEVAERPHSELDALAGALTDANAAALLAAPRERSEVVFTIHFPKEADQKNWQTLLAYVHTPDAEHAVQDDAKARLLRPGSGAAAHGRAKSSETASLARGAKVTIVPELPGFEFDKESATVAWREDLHCEEFRLRALAATTGAVNGAVRFFVGPVLVGEVSIWCAVSSDVESEASESPNDTATADSFCSVFISYSHADMPLVRSLEASHGALGMELLRDERTLRSGDVWAPKLLALIDRADLFQLCWSANASGSPYVEMEWRHALALRRAGFIRPMFWDVPMPAPPPELRHLHFARMTTV